MGEKKVFITGAAGFAGSRLTKSLLSLGYEVTGLDLTAPNHAGLLQGELSHPGFRYLWKSVQDIQPSDVGGHSVVAHLAAQPDTPMAFESPRYTVMQNVGATVELLEAVDWRVACPRCCSPLPATSWAGPCTCRWTRNTP